MRCKAGDGDIDMHPADLSTYGSVLWLVWIGGIREFLSELRIRKIWLVEVFSFLYT